MVNNQPVTFAPSFLCDRRSLGNPLFLPIFKHTSPLSTIGLRLAWAFTRLWDLKKVTQIVQQNFLWFLLRLCADATFLSASPFAVRNQLLSEKPKGIASFCSLSFCRIVGTNNNTMRFLCDQKKKSNMLPAHNPPLPRSQCTLSGEVIFSVQQCLCTTRCKNVDYERGGGKETYLLSIQPAPVLR